MNKFVLIMLSVFLTLPAFANLDASFKSYSRPADEMFLLSISALNQNRFEILEMRSSGGAILFRAYAKDYLLTVSSRTGGSGVKILPANSNFSGGMTVQNTLFGSLDAALPTGLKRLL